MNTCYKTKNLLMRAVLGAPLAALLLASAHAEKIGINFQDDWGPNPGDGGAAVTLDAFGIPAANWYNVPRILNSSGGGGVGSNATINLPGGGSLSVEWSCVNTWSLSAPVPTDSGENQVIYGYLDDTGTGYRVRLSGFRGTMASYTVTTVASTDAGGSFADAVVAYGSDTNALQYSDLFAPPYANGLACVSTASAAVSTLNNNDWVVIWGNPKADSQNRSTLAGILIDYQPGGNNPPLIETAPQPPAGIVFPGQTFELAVQASGSPTLAYQWRKNSQPIGGATSATYIKSGVTAADTGAYDVVVTNNYGAITSAVAQVVIADVSAPVITMGPVSQSLYAGYPAAFTVQATGGQLSYQWKKSSTAISGATEASLTISSITADDAATYTVEVSNPVGPTATASASLSLRTITSAYESAVVQTKPLVWFRSSESTAPADNTGTLLNSGSTGAAANGVARRYVKLQQPGAIVGDADKAAEFNSIATGNDGKMVDVPFNAALNPSTFTAELWVKPAEVVGTSARSPLYNRGAGTAEGFLFFAHNGNTKWQFRTYSGTTGRNILSTGDVVAGVWTHLVGVYDASTGMQRFYVNGVEQGTGLSAPDFTPNTSLQMRLGAGRNDLEFGANMLLFKGALDEVAIYDKVLTAAEILEHYQNATNAARTVAYGTLVQAKAPVGYWRFNDAAGPVAPVVVNSGTLGAEWNGAYGFSPQVGTEGPRPPALPGFEADNRGLTLNAAYGHIGAPKCPALNVNTVTVVGWLKREGAPSNNDLGWPCWLGDGGMHIENSSGRPTGELRYHWKGDKWGWGSGLVVPENVWTFVAMVVEPTRATFYMSDGTVLRSSVNATTHAALNVASPLGFAGNQPDRVDRNYLGQHDDFAVYNRALTQSELNTLFMVGTGAKLELQLADGGIIEDTKPTGTPHHGVNVSMRSPWLTSSADANGTNRTGVQQFIAANPSQLTVAADPDFDSPVGTIAFWMRATAPLPDPGNEGAMLVDRRTGSGTVIVLNDGGAIFVQCAGGANSLSGGYLPDDLWHHVAVTYDQSASGSITIYVDGSAVAAQGNTAAWTWPTTQPIEIGRSHDTYWRRFEGQMDDFRVYNKVLTDAEVALIKDGALVDAAALKLRFEFSTAGIGKTIYYPFGVLQSSPALGPTAVWTPVPGATPPAYPFLPTEPSLFFRAAP
jgi:hypothetical protein